MENPTTPLPNWTYFNQQKGMEALQVTMEIEEIRVREMDEQISQLKRALERVIKERDGAQDKCQKLLFEKQLLQQKLVLHQPLPHSTILQYDDDDPTRGIIQQPNYNKNGFTLFSSLNCNESTTVSNSKPCNHIPVQPNKPLPQKGQLLQAVMGAGPLLQTLLLAGPLPQWRRPPPPIDVPPPPTPVKRKRGHESDGSDCSPIRVKHPRAVVDVSNQNSRFINV